MASYHCSDFACTKKSWCRSLRPFSGYNVWIDLYLSTLLVGRRSHSWTGSRRGYPLSTTPSRPPPPPGCAWASTGVPSYRNLTRLESRTPVAERNLQVRFLAKSIILSTLFVLGLASGEYSREGHCWGQGGGGLELFLWIPLQQQQLFFLQRCLFLK